MQIKPILKQVINLAFLYLREWQITHTQRLEPEVVYQNNIRYSVRYFGVLIGNVSQVRNIIVHKELLIKLLTPKLDPYPLVIKELLEFPLLTILAIHLLKNIVLEYVQTSLLKLMDLLIHCKLILIDITFLIPHMLPVLKSTKI